MRVVGLFFFFQAEDGIRDGHVTGVQTCALPISRGPASADNGRAYQDRANVRAWRQGRTRMRLKSFVIAALVIIASACSSAAPRSEERRVGKEWWYRWGRDL